MKFKEFLKESNKLDIKNKLHKKYEKYRAKRVELNDMDKVLKSDLKNYKSNESIENGVVVLIFSGTYQEMEVSGKYNDEIKSFDLSVD